MSAERDSVAEQPAPAAPKKPLAWFWALAVAVILIVTPSFVMGPMLVPFVMIWAFFSFALSFRKKHAPIRSLRLRNLAIYVVAAIASMAVHSHRIDSAQARGQALVTAITAYRADHQRYPPNLEALVPKYTQGIPQAAFGRYFYYYDAAKAPMFFYVTLPPFGRRGYCFKEDGECLGIDSPRKGDWYDFD